MKRTPWAATVLIILSVSILTSCNLTALLGGSSDGGILQYQHTITSGDETFDSSGNFYRIAIANSGFSGNYWADLYIKTSDGYFAKATPYNISGVWYMRIALYPGSVRFKSENSMTGKEICVFYSTTGN